MQGFNMGRYHAPEDLDPSLDSGRLQKKPRLTGPAQNTVRFEMPFAIWCSSCPPNSTSALIAQGVRFNAIKKKVGEYFSTNIFSFRMKHISCGSWIELRLDPANHDFLVTEGAKKRDYGDDTGQTDRSDAGVLGRLGAKPGLTHEQEQKRQDAFATAEGRAADKTQAAERARRVDELQSVRRRDWADPDAANRRARVMFRPGRRARYEEAKHKAAVAERYALGVELLDTTDEDAKRAALVDFGAAGEGAQARSRRPFLNGAAKTQPRASARASREVRRLHDELSGNTRAAIDPFADAGSGKTAFTRGAMLKRKPPEPAESRLNGGVTRNASEDAQGTESGPKGSQLVGYGSDSD